MAWERVSGNDTDLPWLSYALADIGGAATAPHEAAASPVVAMDGFGGYKHAATETLPDAVTVMDPYHVVALVGHKLDLCRQRVQQNTLGHRGRAGDPLYRVRRTLRTRLALLTDRQRGRLVRFPR